jgi:alginate O-acetyltransferase complex protein AlgI
MLFNSITYLLFLPAVSIILFLTPKNYQWVWLLACSILFYYLLLPAYLIVFLLLIPLNFYFGIQIEKHQDRKQQLFNLSLLTNLGVLVFFKYYGILDSFIHAIRSHSPNDTFWKIILPVGLSYFIFTLISYLIEVKRGKVQAEKHLGIFAAYLMFFPKILQGPIERPGKLLPQFNEKKSFDSNRILEGLKLILWGYFKKLVIADRLAIYVNAVYGNSEHHNGTTLAVATLFYSFQLYADFSGYTDIALGSAKIMGFDLTNNFRRPYFATSVKEFWNRWHISFSTWLRDYLFLPLAYFFSGKMKKVSYLNLATEQWIFLFATMITFAICGLWHGEGANFLVWGLLFGLFLTVANLMSPVNKRIRKVLHVSKNSGYYIAYNVVITFLLVTFTFIFFRAENLSQAWMILKKILTSHEKLFISEWQQFLLGLFGIGFLIAVEIYQEYFKKPATRTSTSWIKEQFAYASLVILILLNGVFDSGQFIYFQF